MVEPTPENYSVIIFQFYTEKNTVAAHFCATSFFIELSLNMLFSE
jgi:hypothetical protein